MAAVFTDSEALQPHAQALLVDWRLLEGLTQLLTAAHQVSGR